MEQTNYTPEPKPKMKLWKKIVMAICLIIIGYGIYYVVDIFVSPDRNIQQIYLIPKDAAIIIQTNDPVNDWKKFSRSEPWLCMKRAPSFAEIAANVASLDSIIRENDMLISMTGKREVMISLHKTHQTAWDFLIVLDLQKVAKVGVLKNQMENIYSMMDYTVTTRRYNGVTITEALDPKTRDILYSALLDNHFIASYTSKLVEASIDERARPQIGLDPAFIDIGKKVANKGIGRIYVNYAFLPQFLSLYMEPNEYIAALCSSMDYAGLNLFSEKDKLQLSGNMNLRENPNPYVAALLNSGNQKMRAHEIMSARTALYLNLGFENPVTFVKELEKALSATNKQEHDSYVTSKQKLEKYFGISMDEHFLGWMAGEFALTQAEPGLLGSEPELILAIKAKNIGDAHDKMDFIEKRIKKRSPINIKTIKYNQFEIKYIEMKGFFRLFFGKLFDKFEKPYYTYIDNYVVFSNKSASLLSFIADFEQKKLMKNNEGFAKAISAAHDQSSIFLYTDMKRFYSLLQPLVGRETWIDIQSHKDILLSFPEWTLQIGSERRNISMHYVMHYAPYKPEAVKVEQEVESDVSETEIMEVNPTDSKEMEALKKFYVEQFEGNVLRDFYQSGALMSECEIKNGKRHGRYKEYHENGLLKIRGNYSNNERKGTWRYYSEEGKLESKERF